MQSSIREYSRGKIDEVMFIAVTCHEYGWTYQEYMAQPIWFIELIRQKMVIDSKNHEMAMKKLRK